MRACVHAQPSVDETGALRLPYDSSEKRRIPAWTDRVLWRGSLPRLPEARTHPIVSTRGGGALRTISLIAAVMPA